MKGSPDRAQGLSGLAAGKLKEELKTLALSATGAASAGSSVRARNWSLGADSHTERPFSGQGLLPAGHEPDFFHKFINLDPQSGL